VLVVNQYYRDARAPIVETLADFRTPEGQAKLGPLRAKVTADRVTRDGAAFVAFLDAQDAVDKRRRIGTQGYCMGGPFTVRTAFAAPGRVGAAASFHGNGLVEDAADSPHRLLARTGASYLIAIARNDDARAPADKETLRQAAAAAGRAAEIEVYPADHGWCVPDAPAYDEVQADRAWARLLALYAGL
jgi:carboxymethylenebutenolidase